MALIALTLCIPLGHVGHAQPLRTLTTPKLAVARPEAKDSSWLFILEQDKQWTLVLQASASSISTQGDNDFNSSPTKGIANSVGQSLQQGVIGNAQGGVAGSRGKAGLKPSDNTASVGGNAGTSDEQGLVIEGNTDDIPLEVPSKKPLKPKKPKSSVSSS